MGLLGQLRDALWPDEDAPDDGPEFDCALDRHEAMEIRVATAGKPLGFFCKRCRCACDEQGQAIGGTKPPAA